MVRSFFNPLHATLPDSIRIACVCNDTETVSAWLSAGGHINARHEINGETLLLIAASRGYEEMVSLLLDAKANPNLASATRVNGRHLTALTAAAASGHMKVVEKLFEAGARVVGENKVIDVATSWSQDELLNNSQHDALATRICPTGKCCRGIVVVRQEGFACVRQEGFDCVCLCPATPAALAEKPPRQPAILSSSPSPDGGAVEAPTSTVLAAAAGAA